MSQSFNQQWGQSSHGTSKPRTVLLYKTFGVQTEGEAVRLAYLITHKAVICPRHETDHEFHKCVIWRPIRLLSPALLLHMDSNLLAHPYPSGSPIPFWLTHTLLAHPYPSGSPIPFRPRNRNRPSSGSTHTGWTPSLSAIQTQTPWLLVSKRPPRSTKLVPTFVGRGCCVISTTDPYVR
jgi:hypothetical protein